MKVTQDNKACIKCGAPPNHQVLVVCIDGTVEHYLCEPCFEEYKVFMESESGRQLRKVAGHG